MAKAEAKDLIVANNIKTVWLNSGLTKSQFAASIDIHNTSMYNYIKGDFSPTANVIKKICTLYHVSSDWLLGLDENAKGIAEEPKAETPEEKAKNRFKVVAEEVVLKDGKGKVINQQIDLNKVSALYLGKYLNIEEIAQIMKETESSVRWALKKLGYR